jgi:hypothetical protein
VESFAGIGHYNSAVASLLKAFREAVHWTAAAVNYEHCLAIAEITRENGHAFES